MVVAGVGNPPGWPGDVGGGAVGGGAGEGGFCASVAEARKPNAIASSAKTRVQAFIERFPPTGWLKATLVCGIVQVKDSEMAFGKTTDAKTGAGGTGSSFDAEVVEDKK